MSCEAKREWLEVWVVFSGHGHALGCYSSRTEAERHAKSFTRLKPLAEACTYCRYVPATEQACAVPASELADWRKLVKELLLAEDAGDVQFRDCSWSSEWCREALRLCGGRPDSVPVAPSVAEAPLHGALAYLTAEVAQYQNPNRAPSRIKRAKELLEWLVAEAGKAPAPSATPSKSEGEWVAPGEPRRPECADPNCGLSTDTAEAFRVIRDCEQYDYCHVECAMSHERDLGRQDGIAESEGEWAVDVLDAWAAAGAHRSWSNGVRFGHGLARVIDDNQVRDFTATCGKAARTAAARALYAADNSLPSPPKGPDAT